LSAVFMEGIEHRTGGHCSCKAMRGLLEFRTGRQTSCSDLEKAYAAPGG
jgi:hypothetical protein